MLLADISQGNTGFADVCFLVALILFLIAGLSVFRPLGEPSRAVWTPIVCLGLAALALGFLVL
jgi:hypothetical protein